MVITSIQNQLIKKILLLKNKSRLRKSEGLFIIEGLRELVLALKGNFEIDMLLFYPKLISEKEIKKIVKKQTELIEVSKNVFEKLAYRSTTEGIIALVKSKKIRLEDLKFKTKKPLILVAEALEKPGNIGALLRTADAAKVDCVLIVNPKTDLFNPNIIRSSVGCVFTTRIVIGKADEIITFLKENKVQLFAAALHKDSKNYTKQNYTKATAIIVGTEATGLSDIWLKESKKIKIPMQGEIDSLNVSASAAILVFEAVRQREIES
ncbi:MAG: RNA methyltransferase [Flavobacteriaceae bacterium]|nr:RNA methyltransferase [Flavobacteriaceae bacterium]